MSPECSPGASAVGNSGWTADPADLTIPPDGAPPNQFIYIGDNDPLLDVVGADFGIVFHYGTGTGFVLGVDQINATDGFVFLDAVDANVPDHYPMFEAEFEGSTEQDTVVSLIASGQDARIALDSDRHMEFNYDVSDGDLEINQKSLARGLIGDTASQGSSAAVAAETVVMTVPIRTYEKNRAFEVVMHGGVQQTAAGGIGDFRFKKTNTAGQTITEFYRYQCPAAGVVYPAHGTAVFKTGANDVTAELVLTLQCPAGTALHFGTAGSARSVTVKDIGASSNVSSNQVTLT